MRGHTATITLAVLCLAAGCAQRQRASLTSPVPTLPLTHTERAALLSEAQSALAKSPSAPTTSAVLQRLQSRITPTQDEFELVHAYVALADRLGQSERAEAQVARWRDAADASVVESVLSLWLGQRFARTSRVEEAAAELRRHLRTGAAVDATSYVWAGSLALARNQLHEAAGFFTQSLALGGARDGPATPRALAQAGYGLALVRDLQANLLMVDEALATATLYDGADQLAKAACNARLDLPVWGGPEARYLCALLNARLGRPAATTGLAFDSLDASALPPLWQKRAQFWRGRELRAAMIAGRPLRLLAVVTTRTDGPWPAPLFDVSWRQPDGFKACLGPAPAAGMQRLLFRLRVSLEGQVEESVANQPPAGWQQVATCFETRLATLLSLPPAPPGEGPPGATLAQVEVLLTSP